MIGPFIEELADEMDNVKFVKVDIDKTQHTQQSME